MKHDAEAEDVIAFWTSMSCADWLAIPTSMIADITHFRNVKRSDHRHPLVKIRLKQPGGWCLNFSARSRDSPAQTHAAGG